MTAVAFKLAKPGPDNTLLPVDAWIACKPTSPSAIEGSPDTTILPAPFKTRTANGQTVIDLTPTGATWAWLITITVTNIGTYTYAVAVPDLPSIDFEDLQRLDPTTLGPNNWPDPVWWAALQTGLQSAQPGPPGEKGDKGDKGDTGEQGESGTNNAANLIGTLTEAVIPYRLTPAALDENYAGKTATNAAIGEKLGIAEAATTYDRVFKPEAYGAVGDGITDDSAAINATITAASGAGGGRVVFGPRPYAVATKISLPATSGITLMMDPRGSITATTAMSSVIEKPAGASTGPITLDGLNVDGASLASAALSILQSNRLTVVGGVYKNGTVAAVDIGNTGLQNYEMEWRGGKIIGRDNTAGKTKADRPAFALRIGAGCTDNVIADVKIKNALTMVQDNGQANVFHLVHAYPYPVTGNPIGNTDDWAEGTIGFHAKGNFGSFLDCYADTLEVGFKAEGFFNEIASPRLLWAGGYTPTNPTVGVDLLSASNYVHDGNFNGTYAGTGAIGIRVGTTAYRVGVTNNQFQGAFNGHTNPIKYMSSEWGHRWGNEWDLGSVTDATQNKRADLLNIDRGDANDILMQWGKGNPGRMIALGTGATGYIRLQQTTAGSGWQLGGPGEKVGFAGKTPATPSTLTYLRNTETPSGAALRASLAAVGLVTDSTVGGTPPVSTYLYPLAPSATATSNALGNDVFRAAPALLPAVSITKVGAEVTVAGSTGCTVRLGIYADNGNYAPGALMLDAGTIPGDAVGVAEITLGSPLTLPAGYYWLGAVIQGSPATQPTLRTLSGNNVPPGFVLGAGTSTPTAGQSMVGIGQTAVTAALPATLPSPGGSGAAPVRLFLKLA